MLSVFFTEWAESDLHSPFFSVPQSTESIKTESRRTCEIVASPPPLPNHPTSSHREWYEDPPWLGGCMGKGLLTSSSPVSTLRQPFPSHTSTSPCHGAGASYCQPDPPRKEKPHNLRSGRSSRCQCG